MYIHALWNKLAHQKEIMSNYCSICKFVHKKLVGNYFFKCCGCVLSVLSFQVRVVWGKLTFQCEIQSHLYTFLVQFAIRLSSILPAIALRGSCQVKMFLSLCLQALLCDSVYQLGLCCDADPTLETRHLASRDGTVWKHRNGGMLTFVGICTHFARMFMSGFTKRTAGWTIPCGLYFLISKYTSSPSPECTCTSMIFWALSHFCSTFSGSEKHWRNNNC